MHQPAPAPPSAWDDAARFWTLDPSITFLNHGSFGATPAPVLDAQTRFRASIERRPIEMLGRRVEELLRPSREKAATLLRVSAEDIGFVTNATEAINGVLQSLRLEAGDELLTTNHVYPAVRQVMRATAARSGAKVVEANVDAPLRGPSPIVEAIESHLSERTRMLVIDQVTSPTALVFPVEQVIRLCQKRGIRVLVDGAHGPGMLKVDLAAMGADYYTANLHKWLCAPKGCGILWVRKALQPEVHPAVISHFYGQGFAKEFGWQGTRDITAWMCAGEAIDFMNGLGLDRVMAHNHAMATWAQAMLADAWKVETTSPRDGSMIGSMATVRLPEQARRFESTEALQRWLYETHQVEAPIIDWGGRWWVRVSCQVYNRPEAYERLAEAMLARMPVQT
jgi:isopenicillin-N epimerase